MPVYPVSADDGRVFADGREGVLRGGHRRIAYPADRTGARRGLAREGDHDPAVRHADPACSLA